MSHVQLSILAMHILKLVVEVCICYIATFYTTIATVFAHNFGGENFGEFAETNAICQ